MFLCTSHVILLLWHCSNATLKKGGCNTAHLLLGLLCMAHNEGHILDLSEGRHGRISRQPQQQVCARIVLRNLPHHAPVRAVAAHQILAVYEICTKQARIPQNTAFDRHMKNDFLYAPLSDAPTGLYHPLAYICTMHWCLQTGFSFIQDSKCMQCW